MKSEYYTLHSNGSFERIDNVKSKKQKSLLTWSKHQLVSVFSFMTLLSLGATLITILSFHISQNVLYQISQIIQVGK